MSTGILGYTSFLNSSMVSPVSRTMTPMVKAFTGFARGMVWEAFPTALRLNFDLADSGALERVLDRREVLLDGILDVLKSL